MGYEICEVPYIGLAERLGVGSSDLSKAKIIALNDGVAAGQKSTRRIAALEAYAAPDAACSACYGSLIYALNWPESESGRLNLPDKICIGQGYRRKTGMLGVGNCTCEFTHSVGGCLPTAGAICEFRSAQMKNNRPPQSRRAVDFCGIRYIRSGAEKPSRSMHASSTPRVSSISAT